MSAVWEQYAKIKAMVIDESNLSRDSLATTLRELGISQVQTATGYAEALRLIPTASPDLILCDYHLGKTAAGQALLEECRRKDLLSPHCAFVMVTSEREQKKIMAAAEWEPDEYLLRPFTPQTLTLRVERCISRKFPLRRAAEQVKAGEYASAVEELKKQVSPGQTGFQPGAMRLLIETLLKMGQPAQAQALANDSIKRSDAPWARLLYARAVIMKGQPQEAIPLLEQLIVLSPKYMMAHDELQKAYQLAGRFDKAQEALEVALALSPHNAERRGELGLAAFRAGDYDKAIANLEEALKGSGAGAAGVDTWAHLANALLEKGEARKAKEIAGKMGSAPGAPPESKQIADSLIIRAGHALSESPEKLEALLEPLRGAFKARELGRQARVHVIAAAYACGDLEFAERALFSALKNQSGSALDFSHLKTVLQKMGRYERFKALQEQVARARAQEISKTRELQQAGLWQEAAIYLIDLSSDQDAGIPLLHQTCEAIAQAQLHQPNGDSAKEFILRLLSRAREMDSAHPLINAMDTLHKSIALKY